MKKLLTVLACTVLAVGFLTGCSKGVDENKPISEVKAEAVTLDEASLKARIADCEKFLAEKKAELDKVAAKVKEIPLDKILSEESKKLKEDAAKISESIQKVSAQMKVYADEVATKAKSAAKK